MTRPALKLKRVRYGVYRTKDGRYTLMRDPLSSGEPGGYGFRAWLAFDETEPNEPLWLGESIHAAKTLREARELLAAHIAKVPA